MAIPAELECELGSVRCNAGNGGLKRLVVQTRYAEAHVYLHGAHVTHYQPRGQPPVLMLSSRSHFQDGKPIRGGVPVIFPWFGAREGHPEAPMHGLVRTKEWSVDSVAPDGQHITLSLSTASDDATRAHWPHEFRLRHDIRVGPTLEMSLTVENASDGPFTFEEALHTYYAVADVRKVGVTGLKRAAYLDKNQNMARLTQDEDPIAIQGKTDRVYIDTPATCVATDLMAQRRIVVEKKNSLTTVVWCPWMATLETFPDLGEGQWQQMICIETCNAKVNAVKLPAGQRHSMSAIVRVEPI